MIEAPPRHGKSEGISKNLPAWFVGRFPDRNVILTSYEANFARGWGRKARQLIAEHGFGWFGVTLSRERNSAADWGLEGHDGGMVTAGVGGPLTGKGAHLLIVDDPIKNAEQALSQKLRDSQWDWWQSTAATRLEPGGVAIVMATRWHKDDLSGRLQAEAARGSGEPVRVVSMPAIAGENDYLGRQPGEALWPERWPIESLERTRQALDRYWFNALYQQKPSKHGRTAFPDEYFGDHLRGAFEGPFELSAMAIDPSQGKDQKRGDYAAIAFVGLKAGRLHVDVWMDRKPASGIVAAAIEMYSRWLPDEIVLESNGNQDLLVPEFDRQCQALNIPPLPVDTENNQTPKELRIGRLGPHLEQKRVVFSGSAGSTLCLQQLEEWPLGDHDDGPDAVEMAIWRLNKMAMQAMQNHQEKNLQT